MELKQFISQTLSSIIEGIVEAQKQTDPLGAFVNPGGAMRATSAMSQDAIWDNRNNNIARLVGFDVAVTVEEGTKANAKIGVLSGIFNAGAGGSTENKELAVSRVKFDIPVLFPVVDLPPDARKSKA